MPALVNEFLGLVENGGRHGIFHREIRYRKWGLHRLLHCSAIQDMAQFGSSSSHLQLCTLTHYHMYATTIDRLTFQSLSAQPEWTLYSIMVCLCSCATSITINISFVLWTLFLCTGVLMACDLFHARGFATFDQDWGRWSCTFPLLDSFVRHSPAEISLLYFVSFIGKVHWKPFSCQFRVIVYPPLIRKTPVSDKESYHKVANFCVFFVRFLYIYL
jgi:hypothetical protein